MGRECDACGQWRAGTIGVRCDSRAVAGLRKFRVGRVALRKGIAINARAIVVSKIGGPDVFELASVVVPPPGPGEVLVRHRAIGLNFVEIYFRSGVYPAPSMPFTPGSEAAGIVEAIGSGATGLKIVDRVA